MMMYKLLAEADFMHFQQTGLPITDLEYRAYPWGPLPEKLHNEITRETDLVIPEDFSDSLASIPFEYEDTTGKLRKGFMYAAKRNPDLKVFSPRQQRILELIAEIYRDATPTEASKASHEPGKPWTKTIKMKGEKEVIDMVETVDLNAPITKDIARDRLRERNAFLYNLGS